MSKLFKPFKPPMLVGKRQQTPIDLASVPDSDVEVIPESDDEVQPRPYKKRKLLVHEVDVSIEKASMLSSAAKAPRKPLLVVNKPVNTKSEDQAGAEGVEGYYIVLWRKFTNKKHKTWDGDGVLAVWGGYARLQDISGKEMGKIMYNEPLLPGSTLSLAGRELEIDSSISKSDFLAGKPFLKGGAASTANSEVKTTSTPKLPTPRISLPASKGKSLHSMKRTKDDDADSTIDPKIFYGKSTHKSDGVKGQFKNPVLNSTVVPQNQDDTPTPRHATDALNALVMKRPFDRPKGKQIMDVVVDPFLSQHLRPHQREGVKFLYECVMGLRDFNGQGALLADEMGLGKTLQTIALIWTLLKQSPFHPRHGKGIIKKALIVCPVTLINNWQKEFRKWLGNDKIGVFVSNGDNKTKLTDFTHGNNYQVMIIGYEKLRSLQEELKKGGIDIVIADEGHRLKTAQNKSALAIRNLNTERRVILSGTPLQNDLSEFYTMVDFINPGLLGTYNTFKKEFEAPILKSRQPGASKRDIEKGNAREEELSTTTKQFILRRTAEILSKYLPPKSEYILFCKPTQAQVQVYDHVLGSPIFDRVVGSTEASLQLITILKKVCNAPSLLIKKEKAAPSNGNVAALLEIIPTELLHKKPLMASSKFRVLDRLLKQISQKTREKIVVVSNYTSTLDILGQHLSTLDLPFLRLDGSTPAAKRQDLVDTFNRTSASKNFAFLLSAKSGGAGINLIGASRLVLFDVDWNPATDLQAMARIHRDGQKLPVKIYRFLMAGGMDEKIYQRQVTKMGLADSVVDGKKNEASFSAEELRDLFRLDLKDGCQTHDLLGCECKGLGAMPPPGDAPLDDPIVIEESSDDDDTLPLVTGIRENIDMINLKIAAKRQKAKKSKGKMQALMRYQHVDTTKLMGEDDIFGFEHEDVAHLKGVLDDEILVEVVKDERCKVDYVFAKHG
ncbi:SNF2 family N-terminal domain-containing protein [Calycina marina]|uniref:SNF2 family N-terminal domain-containing protein n=1 Tax=Calycina marina TaxID=1763456 RepID=A0A9P7Z6H6_9HELO|nr:SNF2 family N-terminal domain-containing protein [Calycina marina]